jgi:hypothetical protein
MSMDEVQAFDELEARLTSGPDALAAKARKSGANEPGHAALAERQATDPLHTEGTGVSAQDLLDYSRGVQDGYNGKSKAAGAPEIMARIAQTKSGANEPGHPFYGNQHTGGGGGDKPSGDKPDKNAATEHSHLSSSDGYQGYAQDTHTHEGGGREHIHATIGGGPFSTGKPATISVGDKVDVQQWDGSTAYSQVVVGAHDDIKDGRGPGIDYQDQRTGEGHWAYADQITGHPAAHVR